MLGGVEPGRRAVLQLHRPEPTGVVAILAPDEPPLLGLVSRLAPALVGGNAVVAVASEAHPLAAVELAEAIATSDVPGGVVNILTGFRDELAPWLAAHMDVNAIDLTGADGDAPSSSGSPPTTSSASCAARADGQSPWEIARFLELKTVWHPIGRLTRRGKCGRISRAWRTARYRRKATSMNARRGERGQAARRPLERGPLRQARTPARSSTVRRSS